jgi:hypothetical protein
MLGVGKVVLVAPSLGLNWDDASFFDFEINPNIAARSAGLLIFGSDNDRPAITEAIAKIRLAITGIQYRQFSGLGHFTLRSMGSGPVSAVARGVIKNVRQWIPHNHQCH